MTKLAPLLALVLLVTCGSDKTPVYPEPQDEKFCPVTFEWDYKDAEHLFEQHAESILTNTFSLTLSRDSIVEGKGELFVVFKESLGEHRAHVTYRVLWPFIGYYVERADTVRFQYADIWLTRRDVLTRRVVQGLLTESLDSAVMLRLLWKKC